MFGNQEPALTYIKEIITYKIDILSWQQLPPDSALGYQVCEQV